jgi:hypothetical protein
MKRSPWILVGVLLAWTVAASVSIGKPIWVKKAKELGYPAKNCEYCHSVKLPKKDTFKPDQLNARGKWLLEQKEKNKAKEVNLEWLKDYPGGKEQK